MIKFITDLGGNKMENENKILFKEILEKYKTVRTPLKNLFRVEDCMSWSILFVTAVVLGFLFWFACTENNHCMFATTVIYVVIVVTLAFINQYCYQQPQESQQYKEALLIFDEELKNYNINSSSKIDMLINWCDSYRSTSKLWFEKDDPIEKLVTIMIIPVIVIAFEPLFNEAGDDMLRLIQIVLILMVVIGFILFIVWPSIKTALNPEKDGLKKCRRI